MAKAQDDLGNRVLVADDGDPAAGVQPYNESFTLTSEMTLTSSDGGVDPKPIVNGNVTIDSLGASIDHLELKSSTGPTLVINGPGTIADNAFTATNLPDFNSDLFVQSGTGNLTIERNAFTDDGVGLQIAINKDSSAMAVSILDNAITGFYRGIFVTQDNGPAILGNAITGGHDSGEGIVIYGGLGAEVAANAISSPASSGDAFGIVVSHVTAPATSATLARNTVLGPFVDAIDVVDTASFSLDSDLVAGAVQSGLSMLDTGVTGSGAVTATNATIVDNIAGDIFNNNAALTLNSSITGDIDASSGAPTCAISFSRGDVANGTPGNTTNCDDFQTAANPLFVNPAMGDYQLQSGSSMIDAGDPAPPSGALDVFGNARALSAVAACSLSPGVRDIGAAEFVPASGVDCPVAGLAPITTTPAETTAPKKKCKRKRKHKRAAATKKKRCKKKRKK